MKKIAGLSSDVAKAAVQTLVPGILLQEIAGDWSDLVGHEPAIIFLEYTTSIRETLKKLGGSHYVVVIGAPADVYHELLHEGASDFLNDLSQPTFIAARIAIAENRFRKHQQSRHDWFVDCSERFVQTESIDELAQAAHNFGVTELGLRGMKLDFLTADGQLPHHEDWLNDHRPVGGTELQLLLDKVISDYAPKETVTALLERLRPVAGKECPIERIDGRAYVAIHDAGRLLGVLSVPVEEACDDSLRLFAYVLGNVLHRKQAEAKLQRARDEFQLRVNQRTAELSDALRSLKAEIAERQEAEAILLHERQLMTHLMDNIPDNIYFKDLQSRFIRINRSMAEKLGLPSVDHGLGLTDADFFAPEHALAALADEKDVIATERPVIAKEEREVWKDGRETWVSSTKMPLYDNHGKVIGTFGISRDVTERRRADKALLHAQKLESLGVLAGGIAHDFNNLLTVIIGSAELSMVELGEDAPVNEYLQSIQSASHRAAELCRELLAYAGRGRYVVETLDLNHLIKEIGQLMEVSVGKDRKLKLHLPEGLPPVQGDALQLRQVVMNLVVNASEAIGGRSGEISVITGTVYADRATFSEAVGCPDLPAGEYLFLEVVDNGCGMDLATRNLIFDPFFTTKFQGRGLGLAAVLGITQSHNGAILVESAPEKGSRFRLLFPPSSGVPTSYFPELETMDNGGWKGHGTILVVDDEESVRRISCAMAETMGFATVSAPDGLEAFRLYAEKSNDILLVLLDMTMPYMDGLSTFRELRKVRQDARVILMSGYTEEDAANIFAGEGLAAFLQKPFTMSNLREKLRKIVTA